MTDPTNKVREFLNFSGFPFQHYCADQILKLDQYEVAAEVPFTYPPTNGPLLGLHGTIDLLAARPDASGDTLLCFAIECKKANDKIKNWVLIPNKQQSPKWPTFVFSLVEPGEREQLGSNRGVAFPKLGYHKGADFDYCVNGLEVNTALTSANQDKSEKIYNPLKQVVHGCVAFEATYPKIVEGIEYFRREQHRRRLFIPVVVTTANIYVVDFARDQVQHGEIPEGELVLGSPVDWATFEFALPDYLSYEVARNGGATRVSKRTVFIVNDKALTKFFAGVVEAMESQGSPA